MYGLWWGRVECRGRDRVGLNIGLGFSFNEVQIAVPRKRTLITVKRCVFSLFLNWQLAVEFCNLLM